MVPSHAFTERDMFGRIELNTTQVEVGSVGPAPVGLKDNQTRYLKTLTVVVMVGLWGSQVFRSLWIDELGSYWIVKGGIVHATQRALQYQGESPLYYWLLWISRNIFGQSEIALRSVSILAGATATFLVYRIGRRLIDREMGLLAAALFASLSSFAFAAVDARPYALALALSIASTLVFIDWLETGKRSASLLYVILATLTVYAHFIFALALLPHLVILAFDRRSKRLPLMDVVIALMGIGILTIPAVPQLLSLFSRRGALTIPTKIYPETFLKTLGPPVLIAALILGLVISRLIDRPYFSVREPNSHGVGRLLVIGFILPTTLLLAISLATPTTLFAPRYYLMQAPYLALLAAWGIRSVGPARTRRIMLLSVAIISVLAYPSINADMNQDWRGAAKTVNNFVHDGETPVLIRTALTESRSIAWVQDPRRRDYLLSPLSRYPMNGRPILLPFDLTHGGLAYVEGLAAGPLANANRFLLVSNYLNPFEDWLAGRLQGSFVSQPIWASGTTQITEFIRIKS